VLLTAATPEEKEIVEGLGAPERKASSLL